MESPITECKWNEAIDIIENNILSVATDDTITMLHILDKSNQGINSIILPLILVALVN